MRLHIRLSRKMTFLCIIIALLLVFVTAAYSYTRTIPNPGVGGDRILIAVDGQEMQLQEALDLGLFGDYEGGVDVSQCKELSGGCGSKLTCPQNYIAVHIYGGCGRGQMEGSMKCCKLK